MGIWGVLKDKVYYSRYVGASLILGSASNGGGNICFFVSGNIMKRY